MLLAAPKITPAFLHALNEGRLGAWQTLYNAYAPSIYGYILQRVPQEIACSVLVASFREMYQHIHEYKAGDERFFTWMIKITLRNCLNELAS